MVDLNICRYYSSELVLSLMLLFLFIFCLYSPSRKTPQRNWVPSKKTPIFIHKIVQGFDFFLISLLFGRVSSTNLLIFFPLSFWAEFELLELSCEWCDGLFFLCIHFRNVIESCWDSLYIMLSMSFGFNLCVYNLLARPVQSYCINRCDFMDETLRMICELQTTALMGKKYTRAEQQQQQHDPTKVYSSWVLISFHSLIHPYFRQS